MTALKIVAVACAWFLLIVVLPCSRPARYESGHSRPSRYMDRVMLNFVMLPLTVTDKHPSKAVRLLGLGWHCVWLFPAMALAIPAVLPLMFGTMIAETLKEPTP